MQNEQTTGEIYTDAISQEPKTSKLAVTSMVFGMLGPFSAGAMWIISFNNFLVIARPFFVALFSFGLAWVLGLALGIQSLKRIENSRGRLLGKQYALGAIVISAAWMVLILAGLLLPMLFYVNS